MDAYWSKNLPHFYLISEPISDYPVHIRLLEMLYTKSLQLQISLKMPHIEITKIVPNIPSSSVGLPQQSHIEIKSTTFNA